MRKVCILVSGHLRNSNQIIDNLKENLLKPLTDNGYEYSVYIHTWDDNITNNKMKNTQFDQYYKKDIYDVELLMKTNSINIGGILIENQKEIFDKMDVGEYLDDVSKLNKAVQYHSTYINYDKDFVREVIRQNFFTFYGHYKSFEMIKDPTEYSHCIKTRPDNYYKEKFDIEYLSHDSFFPNSHLHGGRNINLLFFGGKMETMIKILNFFPTILYKKFKGELLEKYMYHKDEISFECLFRVYIFKYLNLKPFFCKFNPPTHRYDNTGTEIEYP